MDNGEEVQFNDIETNKTYTFKQNDLNSILANK